jgi:hypothetical protein
MLINTQSVPEKLSLGQNNTIAGKGIDELSPMSMDFLSNSKARMTLTNLLICSNT